jgi:hypothetical protein
MIATNPNFSGSSQATNSPNVSLPYLWDSSLNGGEGAWRPTATGDFMTATIENAQISVDLKYTEDSVNVWTSDGQTLSSTGNLQVGNAVVSAVNPVPVNGTVITTATNLDIRDLTAGTDTVTAVATDLDIRGLTAATDTVTAIQGATANSLFTDTLTVTQVSNPAGLTGTAVAMENNGVLVTSHGYLVEIDPTGEGYAAVFEIEASSDGGSTWVLLERNTLSGSSSTPTGVAYFDTWNFKHARTSICPLSHRGTGPSIVSGNFKVRGTHSQSF